MKLRKFAAKYWLDFVSLIVFGIIFIIPFIYIVFMASKTRQEASQFSFTWPSDFQLFENLHQVMTFGNNRMLLALFNSTVVTVSSVALIIVLSSLVAYVMHRRSDRIASIVGSFILAGLIIPPAVVPTIFLLKWLGIYKTLFGMIMIDVAFNLPFAILVFKAFMGTISRELDEAAMIDGAPPLRIFFSIILPLLRPAIVTVVVTSFVTIFNDFVGPLYFLPGNQNVTAPLTLFSFTSQFASQWNLLFADVIIITIIPLLVFIFFQRQLVSGMTSGAIKG
ncbi:MAG: carbohydrate ABC transporter permease [Proteobacteria bacterium]|nr:carbohydrate ABC transporter permease [Pseudomonadota bacterium]